jgi:putative ABC transport system permease protein
MSVAQSFSIALEMLRNHKLRAFLTMLGVIIGVMSVTVIVMISSGFQAYMASQFQSAGADTLFVFFDPGRMRHGQTTGGIEGLKMGDVTYLMDRVPILAMDCPVMSVQSQPAKYGDQVYQSPRIYASNENCLALNSWTLLSGRGLTKADIDQKANVCLIGEDVRDQLFGKQPPFGKLVLFNGIALEVVGVIKKASFLGDDTSRMVLAPISTAQDKWVGGDRLDMILLRPKPEVKSADAMDAVWRAMMLKSGNKPIYRVDSNASIAKIFDNIFVVAGSVLAGIAALSLLVGGIGIMNIMLVSVTERTKEIGLRKAVGAKRGAILLQFLVEAATLSLVGGLIGMFLAWALGNIVTIGTAALGWMDGNGLATPFPITAGIMSAVFSAFIGVVFGLYPAISASKLDPIVALRHE